MIIKVHCHTNLDLNNYERWPDMLCCRPICGDIITSSTGLELQVVRVSHVTKYKEDSTTNGWSDSLDVELHLIPSRFENISSFEKWYRNRAIGA